MATYTMTQESLDQGHFYVPQFEVRISGVGLPHDVLRDVREVTYHDSLTEIDGFEMTVNNWDPVTRDFKYVGAETGDSLSLLQKLFEPSGRPVELYFGYPGKLQLMLKGNFSRMEPRFPSSGGPTLSVSALNLLHRFRDKKNTSAWTDKKDSEIAETFHINDPDTGKQLEVKSNSTAKSKEQSLPYLAQNSMYDIDFLLWRARKRGYVLVLQEAETDSKGKVTRDRQIYFGPSEQAGLREATVKLRWGASLMEFQPSLSTANQVKSVTVRGWNRDTKKAIVEKVSVDDQEIKQNNDLHRLLTQANPREEEVVNEPVFTPGEARRRAMDLLKERLRCLVKASCTCVGLPDLRAGRNVVISGVGARFGGTYFITNTTHSFGANGYTVSFDACREHTGEAESA
jgi:phage protein D